MSRACGTRRRELHGEVWWKNGKRQLGKPRNTWDNDIKIDLK
jgi:hypothetical protein